MFARRVRRRCVVHVLFSFLGHTRDTFCPTNQPHSAQSNCERKVERSAFPATSPRVLSLPTTHTQSHKYTDTLTHIYRHTFSSAVLVSASAPATFSYGNSIGRTYPPAYYSAHRDSRRAYEDSHQHHPHSPLLAFHSFYSAPCAVFVVLSNMSSKCVSGVLFKQTEKSPYSGCQVMFKHCIGQSSIKTTREREK